MAAPARLVGLVQNSTYPFTIVINGAPNAIGQSVDYSTATSAVVKFSGTDPATGNVRVETWTAVGIASQTSSQLVLTVTPQVSGVGSITIANEAFSMRPEVTLGGSVVHPEVYFVGIVEAEAPKQGAS